eukprot:Phypoly_transcript_00783.p1 GENE.Phypoly_transcript_00783~~Phypoly_transcript_00783.p1  ORF type:complete len:474 (+),score=57.43 Phypoly_transcript_00783:121-1542(+)
MRLFSNRATGLAVRQTTLSSVWGTRARAFHLWEKPKDSPTPVTYQPISVSNVTRDMYDVAIVGGGIVGLATAREVLRRYPNKTVVVLEKERVVAPHQSSHNSGVIHAGIYYVPGSNMAYTCVHGAELMYKYCEEHKLPAERVGKMIVAIEEKEHPIIQELYRRGTANGVKGLEIINKDRISQLEPNIVGHSALYSPNTGIADYGLVSHCIAHEIIDTKNADVKLAFDVRKFEKLNDGTVEISGAEPNMNGPIRKVKARNVITCAGFYADRVAELTGGKKSLARVVTFRGGYLQFKPEYRGAVHMNVYPVPSNGGIPVGIHYTPTVNTLLGRQVIVGPGACLTFSREGYRFFDFNLRDVIDVLTNPNFYKFGIKNFRLSLNELYMDLNKRAFFKHARKMMPGIREEMIEDSFAGVMSQVFTNEGSALSDYVIERNVMGGSVLNVRNAPSPAATASFAIAEMVVDAAESDFKWKK